MYLANCEYKDVADIKGRLVSTRDGITTNVVLNILSEDMTDVDFSDRNIKCITVLSDDITVPEGFEEDIFREYTLETLNENANSLPSGVVPLLKLEDSYSNMMEVYNLSLKYPKLRVIGGNLLALDGVKIGRYERGKDKMGIVFKGQYDTYDAIDLADLDYKVVERKKSVNKRVQKSKALKAKSTKEKVKKASSQGVNSRKKKVFEALFSEGAGSF
jgi:hypothetical protein